MQHNLVGMAHRLWSRWAVHLFRPDSRPRYFLIIGNGRTGSTWLQTTFDQLPDVRTRLELKIRLPYQEPHPLHVYVDGSTVSIKDCILQACGVDPDTPPAPLSYGSKLIFDPYGYLDPEIFDRLGELLDKNIRTILLKRSYAAQFTSWKLRGVYHELNADAVSEAASLDQQFVDVVSSWKPPKLKTMLFTLNGAPLAGADPKAVGPDAINYPAEDAVEDLLVLFYNDLMALALAQQQVKYAVVDYDEIGEKFSGLVRLVGSEAADEEIRKVLGRPITKRLQTLGPERTQPPGFLTRLSACFDIAFARAVTSQTSNAVLQWNQTGNAVMQWSPGKKFFLLNIEGLAEILSDYGVPYESPSSPDTAPKDRLVRWLRRRPIYEFADVGK